MSFFTNVVLISTLVISIIAFIVRSRFQASKKKRQIRLRNFRNSKLPKLIENNPLQLGSRRANILLRGNKRKITITLDSTYVQDQQEYLKKTQLNSRKSLLQAHNSLYLGNEPPSIIETHNIIPEKKQEKEEDAGKNEPGYELHEESDDSIRSSGESIENDGYIGYNGSIEAEPVKVVPITTTCENKILPVPLPSIGQNNDNIGLPLLRTEDHKEKQISPVSFPPVNIKIQNNSSKKGGYSLLDALKQKKKKNMHGYRNVFSGTEGEVKEDAKQENSQTNKTIKKEKKEKKAEPENNKENGYKNIQPTPLPDAYKYLSKQGETRRKQVAYLNPYTHSTYDIIPAPYAITKLDDVSVHPLHNQLPANYVQTSDSDTDKSSNASNNNNPEKSSTKKKSTKQMLRLSEERTRNRDLQPLGGLYEAFDHLLDGVDLHDWNERFQRIMTTIRKFNSNTTVALQIKANRALIHLAQDFIYASSTYGKIIISEVYSAEKTIKPINLGGKLGGTKYIVQNILFKFAVDESGLYSDHAAAKVAAHELKGLINYFNCNIEDLCLPLMSLVDYRGFRLIAMSILPIRGSETIIYGSDNYGETIYNEELVLENLLKRAAKMVNIKEHQCGMNVATSRVLCSPADLEGHRGTDGRFYLLDFSRVLPPETPVQSIPNAHLYRLLRPELVKNYRVPLCSDAFSGFIAKFQYKEDNREVVLATNELLNVIIPNFSNDLTTMMLEARDKGELGSFRLTEAIHRQGINVRYLGVLRKSITELDCRTFLLVEMSARIVKNKLRKLLRKKMKELKVPLEEPYRRLVISYLNLILGDSEASEEYWNNNIKRAIQRTFVQGMSEQESNVAYSLKSSLSNFSNDRVDGKLLLFLRLQKMTGLRFTNRINEEFSQNPNNWAPRGAQPLDETDLEDIGLRVKHMNIISHAQGFVLQMKGAMTWAHDPVAAERFYNMVKYLIHFPITKYEEALDTNSNDYQALIRCAEIAAQFIEGHARGVAAMKYNIESSQVQYANMLYQRAVTANPKDSYGLYRYAQFFDKCQMPEEAEEMFLRSLEADPENVACLQEYGNFLTERNNHEMAEKFYLLGSELAQKYSAD